jgi:hypothetical protein
MTGASMSLTVTGTSLSTGSAGAELSADSIVLVGKDGSLDLDVLYEVRGGSLLLSTWNSDLIQTFSPLGP